MQKRKKKERSKTTKKKKKGTAKKQNKAKRKTKRKTKHKNKKKERKNGGGALRNGDGNMFVQTLPSIRTPRSEPTQDPRFLSRPLWRGPDIPIEGGFESEILKVKC